MLKHNLKSSWRNLWKDKFFAFLNIGGVAIAIAVTALILFWVVDELSFDKYHKNLDQIYTVYEHQVYSDGQELYTPCTPFPLSSELRSNYAEVINATTYVEFGEFNIQSEDKEFREGPVALADSCFMGIFSFDVLEGDKNALDAPDKIIITKEIADLFFNGKSAIGEVLKINGEKSLTVGAVIAPSGKHSTLDFKVLAPINLVASFGADLTAWGNNWPMTNMLVAKGTNAKELEGKITNLCKDKGQDNTSLHLFPYSKERLYSYSGKNNRIQYIYQFLAIAIIIVLIASINFINSSTASSETRRPEVGIRKVLGANKISIASQFLYEKGLMILISILIGIVLFFVFTPLFNQLSGKTISLELFKNKYLIGMILSMFIIILFLSVAYPSLYISSFLPARVLKNQKSRKQGWISFRSILVVAQFSLSIILIICTIAVTSQLKYINNYDLGYEKDNLVYLYLDRKTESKHEALSSEFKNLSGVVNLTKSDKLPFWGGNSSWGYNWPGKNPETKVLICRMEADANYFETLGIKMAEGRGFSPIYEKVVDMENSNINEVILNQEAIRRMELADPVGKFLERNENRASIVGIAKNFNFESLKNGIEPIVITPLTHNPSFIILRINSESFTSTLDELKKTWTEINPGSEWEPGFFDKRIERMYRSEARISGLFKYFSFIAIFIACIGLFGLSVFAIERKKKEIGIRKVNGSKVGQILAMLNKDFVKWVIVAFVLASPLAYYTMSKWLENFAYKTTLSWWIFALAGLLALGIALLTVSWQSWKAATRNPVEALRYE